MPECVFHHMTAARLAEAIETVRARFLAAGSSSVLDINNGLCEDFARDVLAHLGVGEDERVRMVGYDNLCRYDEDDLPIRFDREMMRKHWKASVPPVGLDWGDLKRLGMHDTAHVFLRLDDRCYDADVPNGVASVFDIPVFRRNVVLALSEADVAKLEGLKRQHAWWRESTAMHEEYRAHVVRREASRESVGYSR